MLTLELKKIGLLEITIKGQIEIEGGFIARSPMQSVIIESTSPRPTLISKR